MKRLPALFFDFDGFQFDTTPETVRYINERYGIASTIADYTDNPRINVVVNRYLGARGHVTEDEVYIDLSLNFLRSIDWHRNVPPMEGVTTVIPLLAKKYELWTVTAREKLSLPVIQHLCDTHIPNCISGVHCVWEYMGDKTFKGQPKKDFIAGFEGDKVAFLDDSTHEVRAVQDILPSYLFDPYGLNDHQEGIHNRVRSWQQIAELFL